LVIGIVFIACIGHQPYSFYQLAKTIGLIGFGVLTFYYFKKGWIVDLPLALIGVILFNPFFKVHFRRETWQIIDMWIASVCGIWVVVDLIRMARRKSDGDTNRATGATGN